LCYLQCSSTGKGNLFGSNILLRATGCQQEASMYLKPRDKRYTPCMIDVICDTCIQYGMSHMHLSLCDRLCTNVVCSLYSFNKFMSLTIGCYWLLPDHGIF